MHTLSLEALDTVTGGVSPTLPATNNGGGTSGSGSSDTALQALQGISSSLSDLAKNQNQGLFGGANGPLMMMMMGMALSRRSEVVVYGGGRGWGHHWGW